jgi:hypothetical protein
MVIKAEPKRLKQTQWWEYLVRFLFGGIVTAITGLIAKEYGPVVGGLFLAFPGIFPASVTLVERHERKKKRDKGMHGERRGRATSSVVAAGAVVGAIGLIAFGAIAWYAFARFGEWQTLAAATIGWFILAVAAWFIRFRL